MQTSLGGVHLSARVEVEERPLSAEPLWFEFPGSTQEGLGLFGRLCSCTPAVGHGSPRGYTGTRHAGPSAAFESRQVPAHLPSRVSGALPSGEIRCQDVRSVDPQARPVGVAPAFSGGVDSSYTVWSRLPVNEREPDRRITYALFVHGFDILLGDVSTFEAASARYVDEFRTLGIELVVVGTNVRQFVDELPWEIAHGSALGSLALMLDRLLAAFYLPASFSYGELEPWGSRPLSDPWCQPIP
jgi:hypothetical protein